MRTASHSSKDPPGTTLALHPVMLFLSCVSAGIAAVEEAALLPTYTSNEWESQGFSLTDLILWLSRRLMHIGWMDEWSPALLLLISPCPYPSSWKSWDSDTGLCPMAKTLILKHRYSNTTACLVDLVVRPFHSLGCPWTSSGLCSVMVTTSAGSLSLPS